MKEKIIPLDVPVKCLTINEVLELHDEIIHRNFAMTEDIIKHIKGLQENMDAMFDTTRRMSEMKGNTNSLLKRIIGIIEQMQEEEKE